MENSRRSLAKTSTLGMPGFQPGGGFVTPPVHGGIVPSALPAGSAPTGVRSVPSRAASSGVAASATPIPPTRRPIEEMTIMTRKAAPVIWL